METNRQKWVTGTYLGLAALFGYVVFEITVRLVGIWDLEAKVRNIDLILRGFALVAGLALLLFLYMNERVNQYTHECVEELSRVTWPTADETWRSTWVVLIFSVVAGAVLGILDFLWSFSVNKSFELPSLFSSIF